MTTRHSADLCVIGGGSGGLSVAAAAAQLGASVVLVEKGRMGGDCLNYGCVPSKALIAAARHAHLMTAGAPFGIAPKEPEVNFKAVRDHVHGVISAIAPNDSVERFTGLGVTVILENAVFRDSRTIVAGDHEVTAGRFVIATGSTPAIPPIEGLADVPHLTNETVFDITKLPRHLIVIGGGPVGMELAQAYRRLGSSVTVLEMHVPLGKDDPELAQVVTDALSDEGVDIRTGVRITRVARFRHGVRVDIQQADELVKLEGSHLLVAAGRKPNVDGLGLEAAGIEYTERGIRVDRGLRTTNRRVYAIGDVTGGLQFTHVANYHAGLVVRNALFRMPVKTRDETIPWVTYTDPELAHVGLLEQDARQRHGQIRVMRWPFHENDRALTQRETRGLVKVTTSPRGRVLGASIVGANAGELIQPWVAAVTRGARIRDLTDIVIPYPTLSEVNKRVAYGYYVPSLGSKWLRRGIRLLAMFG